MGPHTPPTPLSSPTPILSALTPAGPEADTLLRLSWLMAIGAVMVWLAVLAIAWMAARRHGQPLRHARWLILGGGVAVPAVVLTGLLVYGLWLLPRVRAAVPPDALRIEVSGEQWWWRVRYPGTAVETANEIHVPVGKQVALELTSPDVIHSLWVPALAGKMDMVPGRRNTLVIQADEVGVYRGVCAEFCGASHAQMRLLVVAQPIGAFEAWLQAQEQPAREPSGDVAASGRAAFLRHGCGACHTARGTPANGRVGPDLTHVGSRLELAAGTLPVDAEALQRWIARPHAAKPGVLMPRFDMLPRDERAAIAAWLEGLE